MKARKVSSLLWLAHSLSLVHRLGPAEELLEFAQEEVCLSLQIHIVCLRYLRSPAPTTCGSRLCLTLKIFITSLLSELSELLSQGIWVCKIYTPAKESHV